MTHLYWVYFSKLKCVAHVAFLVLCRIELLLQYKLEKERLLCSIKAWSVPLVLCEKEGKNREKRKGESSIKREDFSFFLLFSVWVKMRIEYIGALGLSGFLVLYLYSPFDSEFSLGLPPSVDVSQFEGTT
jgi:hypothetical protein